MARIYALANVLAIQIVCVTYKYSYTRGGSWKCLTIRGRAHDARHSKAGRLSLASFHSAHFHRHLGGADSAGNRRQRTEAEAIESVIVTARRRAESLQDTPVAVTALSADALERQQIISTTDLDKVAPNIQFHSYGTLTGNNSAAQVFIRGIGQSDATPAVDPGVGVYIDDVYMGRAVGAAMEFRDIANVQILRGPQGTLFGRNTIGGAVLLTTNEPGTDAGNSVRVGPRRRQSARSRSAPSTCRWAVTGPRAWRWA